MSRTSKTITVTESINKGLEEVCSRPHGNNKRLSLICRGCIPHLQIYYRRVAQMWQVKLYPKNLKIEKETRRKMAGSGDGLSMNLAGMSKNQFYNIMSQMKGLQIWAKISFTSTPRIHLNSRR